MTPAQDEAGVDSSGGEIGMEEAEDQALDSAADLLKGDWTEIADASGIECIGRK